MNLLQLSILQTLHHFIGTPESELPCPHAAMVEMEWDGHVMCPDPTAPDPSWVLTPRGESARDDYEWRLASA